MEKYHIIALERQFASGGRQIGSLLAEKLGFKFYDEEILNMAAKKMDETVEYVQFLEETVTDNFLENIARVTDFSEGQTLSDRLFFTENEIINELVLKENCVIVGHCAGQIIANRENCLSVFIYASEDARIRRATKEYGINENEAHGIIKRNDKMRSDFFNTRTDKKWSSMDSYDICLNSGILGINGCVEVIASMVAPDTK